MNKEENLKKCVELNNIYKDLSNALYINDLVRVQALSSKMKEFLAALPVIPTPPPQEKL